MTQSHSDLSQAASLRKPNWCSAGSASRQLAGRCFPTIKQELCHTSHLITSFFTGPCWTGEPGRWLTMRGPFDRLHLQSHLKVALAVLSGEPRKSITIPLNVLNWPSQRTNRQVQVVNLVLHAGWSFNVRRWRRKAVNHYSCRRGDMSTLTLIDVGFYTVKLLGPSVFSRVFQQLWGQTRQFHGPAVPQSCAAPPPPQSVSRQQSDKVCGRDLFKTPSSPLTSRGGGAIQHTQGDGGSERLLVQGWSHLWN